MCLYFNSVTERTPETVWMEAGSQGEYSYHVTGRTPETVWMEAGPQGEYSPVHHSGATESTLHSRISVLKKYLRYSIFQSKRPMILHSCLFILF